MLKYEFNIFWSEMDKAYIGTCPELNGCMADGQTYEEAVKNLEMIAYEWIENAQLLNWEIPAPKVKHF